MPLCRQQHHTAPCFCRRARRIGLVAASVSCVVVGAARPLGRTAALRLALRLLNYAAALSGAGRNVPSCAGREHETAAASVGLVVI